MGISIAPILNMLTDAQPEKRMAAAIVLGELKVKEAKAIKGLIGLLEQGGPTLQRHALEALQRIGAKPALTVILPLLHARDSFVRAAAADAIVSIGESVVPTIRARLAETHAPEERKELDFILARLGGKEAFAAVLASLDDSDDETARTAALALRQQVRSADKAQRRNYYVQVEKFLKGHAQGSPGPLIAVIKILGYLEDERATDTLVSYLKSKKQPSAIRQEAAIALRFALGQLKEQTRVVNALLEAADSEDRALAQAALMTLSSMELPRRAAPAMERLVLHPEIERAHFAVEQLVRSNSPESIAVLAKALRSNDKRRVEVIAKHLEGKEQALPALTQALLTCKDKELGLLLRHAILPMAKRLPAKLQKELLEEGLRRLEKSEPGAEALIDLAGEANPSVTGEGLRALATKLRKGKKAEQGLLALRILCRSAQATDADRFELACIELVQSPKDTRPAARQSCPSLRALDGLLRHGYPIADSLRKARNLTLDDVYYVGFHFVEKDEPLGADLLDLVIQKGGRQKVARMAKNKLGLAQRTETV